MTEWWQVCERLRSDVLPLLDDDTRAFADTLYPGGEGVLFVWSVLDGAVDGGVWVDPELLTAVEHLILPDAEGEDKTDIEAALASLRNIPAVT
jgi:hypothetical protein